MNAQQDLAHDATVQQDWPSQRLGWYAVAVLFLAYTFSYVDRVILTILVEPIQRDLNINDSQLALLHGLAFVIFYVGLGIPLGYLADRVSRKKLIIASIAVWSRRLRFDQELRAAVCRPRGRRYR